MAFLHVYVAFWRSAAKNRRQRSHHILPSQCSIFLCSSNSLTVYSNQSDTSSIRNLMTVPNKDIPAGFVGCRMSKGPQKLDPKATPLVYNAYVKDTHFHPLSFHGCYCGTWLGVYWQIASDSWLIVFLLALSMPKCSGEMVEIGANLQHDDPAGCSSKVRGGVGWWFSKVVEIPFGQRWVASNRRKKQRRGWPRFGELV